MSLHILTDVLLYGRLSYVVFQKSLNFSKAYFAQLFNRTHNYVNSKACNEMIVKMVSRCIKVPDGQ